MFIFSEEDTRKSPRNSQQKVKGGGPGTFACPEQRDQKAALRPGLHKGLHHIVYQETSHEIT